MTDQEQPRDEPINITAGVDEDPEEVSGEPVDEAEVLGDAVYLADPAAHGQEGTV